MRATDPDQYFVTTTTPSASENYFVAEDSGFSTDIDLRNCTLTKSFKVGLVQSEGNEEAYSLLEGIFDEISNMYDSNNEGVGTKLEIMQFSSTEELEDYVDDFKYFQNRLCFALDWQEFNPDAHIYKLQIRMNYGDVPDTRLPQMEYEESTYN